MQIGRRAFAGIQELPSRQVEASIEISPGSALALEELAQQALVQRADLGSEIEMDGRTLKAWANYRPARPALGIFGAGDDARPLVSMAKELGWFVSLADGRSHLASSNRFPRADRISVLRIEDLPCFPPGSSVESISHLQRHDAAVVMTHSFEQDSRILACLLSLQDPPGYIGVLGPQRRTCELLEEAARLLGIPSSAIANQAERWLAQLHAPTGLDLGAESPETIALSILAEIQKFRTSASALPLCTVRAARVTQSG